jgi:hypothetical protein
MDKPRLDQGPDYERGFIDGMMYQTQTTVNKAVDAMSKRPMTDCPNCEYQRKRTQLWRDEAYKQAGHPLPERECVGLNKEERHEISLANKPYVADIMAAHESKLKEKNT